MHPMHRMRPFAEVRLSLRRNRDADVVELAKKSWPFVLDRLRNWFIFRHMQHLGFGVRVKGRAPVIDNEGGTIELGDHVFFDAPVTPAYLNVEPGAVLRIGADSYLNDGVWLGVTELVSIGARARIAHGVRIIDNDYHEVQNRSARPPSRPIVIEDDVWIASDAMITPGVRVGRGAVVGAHSLVTRDVEPFTVVGGVPARPLKGLDRVAFERTRAPE